MARAVPRHDQDTNELLDWLFDWSAQMDADTDAISSATVSAPSGISLGTPTVTASTVTVFISGGTEGTTYPVKNHVWTTGGREHEKVFELTVIDQPSASHSMVAETGSAASTSNSYSSLADANTYHAGHLFASVWTQAPDAEKEKGLIWASRLLDEQMEWRGQRVNETQGLRWPRNGTTDRDGWAIDGDTIPSDLKNATAELARLLLAEDRTTFEQERPYGFQKIKAGPIELVFDSSSRRDAKPLIPEYIKRMLGPLGTAAGGGVVNLVRA